MPLSLSHGNMVFLFICLLLQIEAFVYPTKADLVSDICSATTIDPQYCEKSFRSDPRSPNADLPTLGRIGIDLAQIDAKSAAALVKSLEKGATDPKLKERYSSCLENYQDTIDELNECTDYLNKKDYASLNIHASAAITDPDTCDDNFNDPPPEPDNLKQASKHVQSLASAICVIANKLLGKR